MSKRSGIFVEHKIMPNVINRNIKCLYFLDIRINVIKKNGRIYMLFFSAVKINAYNIIVNGK